MSMSLLLEMAQGSALAIRGDAAVVSGELRWSVDELSTLADGGSGVVSDSGASHVAYVGVGGSMLPLLLFTSARAAVPVTPLNYRLSAGGLRTLIERLPEPLVIVDEAYRDAVGDAGKRVMTSAEFLAAARNAEPASTFADPEAVAVVLFTSGTTSAPKAVELTRNNVTSYIMGTVEFDSAEPGDAALICVPPYHIAGGVSRAVESVRRPQGGLPDSVRRARVDSPGRLRGGHLCDRRPDDALWRFQSRSAAGSQGTGVAFRRWDSPTLVIPTAGGTGAYAGPELGERLCDRPAGRPAKTDGRLGTIQTHHHGEATSHFFHRV